MKAKKIKIEEEYPIKPALDNDYDFFVSGEHALLIAIVEIIVLIPLLILITK